MAGEYNCNRCGNHVDSEEHYHFIVHHVGPWLYFDPPEGYAEGFYLCKDCIIELTGVVHHFVKDYKPEGNKNNAKKTIF